MIGTTIDYWEQVVLVVPNPRLQQRYNRHSKRKILDEFEIGSNSR
jgi:hypothetical protein